MFVRQLVSISACLFVWLYMSVSTPFMSVYPSVYLSVCPIVSHLSINLCLPLCMCFCQSVWVSVYLHDCYLSVCLHACQLSVCLLHSFIPLSTVPSIHMPTYLFIRVKIARESLYLSQVAHPARGYSETTRSITTLSWVWYQCMARLSLAFHQASMFIHHDPFTVCSWISTEKQCGSKVSHTRTQHSNPTRVWPLTLDSWVQHTNHFSILSLDVVSVVVLSLYNTYIYCSLKFPLAENSIILMEMMMGVGSPNQLLLNIRLTL